MDFRPVKLESYCPSITYNFKVAYLRDTHLINVLVISFIGKYRYGSGGSPDAGLIKGIIKTGLSVFDPFSVVIDLTMLEYTWGDNLDLSFEETDSTKTVVVVGDKCRKGMSSLMFGINSNKDIVDNNFFFDDFEKALSSLDN